jgi:hypothetical protein
VSREGVVILHARVFVSSVDLNRAHIADSVIVEKHKVCEVHCRIKDD